MMQNYRLLFEFMETLGKKWVVPLLLFLLFYEKTNFSEIKRQLRLTSRALSKKLKDLEAMGLIERIVLENPTKVYYALSKKGGQICSMLMRFERQIS